MKRRKIYWIIASIKEAGSQYCARFYKQPWLASVWRFGENERRFRLTFRDRDRVFGLVVTGEVVRAAVAANRRGAVCR